MMLAFLFIAACHCTGQSHVAAMFASSFIHISKITLGHTDQVLTLVCSKVTNGSAPVSKDGGDDEEYYLLLYCPVPALKGTRSIPPAPRSVNSQGDALSRNQVWQLQNCSCLQELKQSPAESWWVALPRSECYLEKPHGRKKDLIYRTTGGPEL